MNIRMSSPLTAAEKTLIDQFDKAAENLPGRGEPWVDALRASAIHSFENSGLPNHRIEQWKYTDLRNMLGEMPPPAENTQAPILLADDEVNAHTAFSSVERHLGVFVNGFFRPELSNLEGIEGLEVISLRKKLILCLSGAGTVLVMKSCSRIMPFWLSIQPLPLMV